MQVEYQCGKKKAGKTSWLVHASNRHVWWRVCTCSLSCRSCYAVNVGRRVHGVILNERTRAAAAFTEHVLHTTIHQVNAAT